MSVVGDFLKVVGDFINPNEWNYVIKSLGDVSSIFGNNRADPKTFLESVNSLGSTNYFEDLSVDPHHIVLRKTISPLTRYSEGLCGNFTVVNTKLGSVKMRMDGLGIVDTLYKNRSIPAGFFVPGDLYSFVYRDSKFHVYPLNNVVSTDSAIVGSPTLGRRFQVINFMITTDNDFYGNSGLAFVFDTESGGDALICTYDRDPNSARVFHFEGIEGINGKWVLLT